MLNVPGVCSVALLTPMAQRVERSTDLKIPVSLDLSFFLFFCRKVVFWTRNGKTGYLMKTSAIQ